MLILINYFFAVIFGLLLGNYATTLLFRLPRGLELSGLTKKNTPPFCANCLHSLKYYEALPLLSWIFSRFKCNYCGVKINPHYFYLEFFTALASLYLFHIFGFSDFYIILLPFIVIALLSSLLHLEGYKVPKNLFIASLVLVIFYRILVDGTIIISLFPLANFFLIYLLIVKKFPSFNREDFFYFALQSLTLLGLKSLLFLPILLIKNRFSLLVAYLGQLVIFFYLL